MESQQPSGGARERGLSHSHVDAIAGMVVFAIGVVMMFDNWRSGAGWAADGPAAGYFPFRVGAILCIAATVVAWRALFGRERDHRVFVTWERLRLVLLVLGPTILYVLAIQLVGIYVASAVFIGAFMRMIDKRGWLNVGLVSVGVSAALFWLFEMEFMVPLPKGPLEALLGY